MCPPFDLDSVDVEPERPSAVSRLIEAAQRLNAEELEVLATIAERMAYVGRKAYGPLDLRKDSRDFRREALEECADGLVYAAVALVKRGDR